VLSLRKDVCSLDMLSLNNWLPSTCQGRNSYRQTENDQRIFCDGDLGRNV